MVVAGIDEQADRFGNKLMYEWSGLTQQDEQDVFLDKISAKVNDVVLPASLQFTYTFAPFGQYGPQDLCSSITLYDGDTHTDESVTFNAVFDYYLNYAEYCAVIPNDSDYEHYLQYRYSIEPEFMLTKVRPYPFSNYDFDVIVTYATHNDDGSLLETKEDCLNIYSDDHTIVKQYDYEYDNKGNLITRTHFITS